MRKLVVSLEQSFKTGSLKPDFQLQRKRNNPRNTRMTNILEFEVYVGIPAIAQNANRLSLLQQFVENDIEDADLLEEEKGIVAEFASFSEEELKAEFLRLLPLVSGRPLPDNYIIRIW